VGYGTALSVWGSPSGAGCTALHLQRRKALALFAYLAVTKQLHSRDALASLWWPEHDHSSARNNLRRDLSQLKTVLSAAMLTLDGEQVALNPQAALWLDVDHFQHQVAVVHQHPHPRGHLCPDCIPALTEAIVTYTDDFMAGFSLPDSPAFEEWQLFQAERLRQALAAALQPLIAWHVSQEEYSMAIEYGRRWLALDLLHEPAQRQLMQLYAWSGQPVAAVRQYQACVRLLDAELSVAPEAETTALYTAIKTKQLSPPMLRAAQRSREAKEPVTSLPLRSRTPAPIRKLPPQPTPFVGRETDLAAILHRLTDPACRLLTLVGPGGIGKTRLAMQAVQQLIETQPATGGFAHGILFVPLAAVSSPAGIVAAIAEAANFTFYSDVPPQQQLLDYLRTKQMLPVLDNVEHLLAGVDVISEILAVAPAVKMLVTSREALHVQEAWFHPVAGLAFPRNGAEAVGRLVPINVPRRDHDALAVADQVIEGQVAGRGGDTRHGRHSWLLAEDGLDKNTVFRRVARSRVQPAMPAGGHS
jgi:DNA-binding SARP family transcriptional activator